MSALEPTTSTPGHYLVRALDQTQSNYDVFFGRGVVAVGWSRVRFAEFEGVEAAVLAVESEYLVPNRTDPRVAGVKKNEVRRFFRMVPGDRIVVPIPHGVRLATIAGRLVYEPAAVGVDLANQRPASYLLGPGGAPVTVPRDRLTEGLQRRLRVRGASVRDLVEFSAEIDSLFHSKDVGSGDVEADASLASQFKAGLLARIQDGRTLLAAGGQGLQNHVAALLEADGYTAEVLSKRAFDGFADADIKASREDHVSEVQLLVQVKHHYGESGAWGAEQLLEIRERHPDTWKEHRLVLVTSGRAAKDLRDVCEGNDVVLIDGEALAEWVFDALHALSPDLRARLRVSSVPALLT